MINDDRHRAPLLSEARSVNAITSGDTFCVILNHHNSYIVQNIIISTNKAVKVLLIQLPNTLPHAHCPAPLSLRL